MAAGLDDMDEGVIHSRTITALFPDGRRRADGDELPPVLYHDAVAVFGFFHEMCRDDDRRPLGRQVRDLPPEETAGQRVDAACRFVEKEDRWFVEQGRCHGQALFVAARKAAGRHMAEAGQIEFFDDRFDALVQPAAAQAVGTAEEAEVLFDGQRRVEGEFLCYIADMCPGLGPGSPQFDAG